MSAHLFEPSQDDAQVCGYRESGTQPECLFPATNRRVHAPGALPGPHLRSVPTIRQDSASVALDAPATSVAAAAVTLPRRGSLRWEIVQILTHPGARGRGLTDDEIEQVTNRRHSTVSSARNSLMQDGLVQALVKDGEPVTRPTSASGSRATAWVLTATGRTAYEAERGQEAAS